MKYYFNKIISGDFDQVIEKVTEELKKEGFGILTGNIYTNLSHCLYSMRVEMRFLSPCRVELV